MIRKNIMYDQIDTYFILEWKTLLLVTIFGLIYNCGLLAVPWFEGRLAGCLMDILTENSSFYTMLRLVFCYLITILIIQTARYGKRFFVRRFANNINRKMKKILYHNLLRKSKIELEQEGIGNLMTKAISDVDDCVEGMRKFTTEIFDTGVALICYCGMLIYYDWRLACLSLLFSPIAYFFAEIMKFQVQRTSTEYKDQTGQLSSDTLDMIKNKITYRIFGCEIYNNKNYECRLSSYEKSAIKANTWVSALQPLYNIICMTGVLLILYFGSKNVLGQGWSNWDIAVFTTFLSCYTKLSLKSSKAAKLFNSVQKAKVSWNRIKPFMIQNENKIKTSKVFPATLMVTNLSFSYSFEEESVFKNLSFTAEPGQIIGITGPVACGKSTLGKVFLCEYPYSGSIKFENKELSDIPYNIRNSIIGYLGHDPELLNDSIKNNILMGSNEDADKFLRIVCMDNEVSQFSEGINTFIGSEGIKLSGGQAKRLALARTLCHKKPILILDDPFSALDRKTEKDIFNNLKELTDECIILLISHRLYLFPDFDQIIWIKNEETFIGNHEELIKKIPQYKELYMEQKEGILDEK